MRSAPTWIKVAIGLSAIATNLPIFAGYTMAFTLFIGLLVSGHWRLARVGERYLPRPGEPNHAFMRAVAAGIKPLHWGSVALVTAHLVAAVLGAIWSPFAKPWTKTLADWSHMALKLGLLWFVVSTALVVLVRLGWEPRRVKRWLFFWLVVQLGYSLVQRSTGIDLSHGLHAVLEPNRFAYGVYRVSAFMGHPLTFAYNLMLITVASAALVWRLPDPEDRLWWLGCMLLCTLTLLISGSRYVLIVLLAVFALCEYRRLWRHKLKVAALLVVCALFLWWEGSVLGRFSELFAQNLSLEQRFTRFVFWRIHWQMFLDFPIFGVTHAGLQEALQAYYTAAGYHDTMYEAHNIFLQYLADTGLIGFCGLMAWFVGLALARRRMATLTAGAQGIGGLAAATILCGLMQNDLRDSAYVYALWFYLSLVLVESAVTYAKQQESAGDERKPPENLQPGAGGADLAAHL